MSKHYQTHCQIHGTKIVQSCACGVFTVREIDSHMPENDLVVHIRNEGTPVRRFKNG